MTLQRMDNVGIVVDDIKAAIAFFTELGMELEGEMLMEGPVADQCVGLTGVRCDIAMLRMPDGNGRIELSKYLAPEALVGPANPPHNTLGMHRVMFAVDDIDATVASLRPHGAEILGGIAQYEDTFRLCYVRGPEGILIGLAQQITTPEES